MVDLLLRFFQKQILLHWMFWMNWLKGKSGCNHCLPVNIRVSYAHFHPNPFEFLVGYGWTLQKWHEMTVRMTQIIFTRNVTQAQIPELPMAESTHGLSQDMESQNHLPTCLENHGRFPWQQRFPGLLCLYNDWGKKTISTPPAICAKVWVIFTLYTSYINNIPPRIHTNPICYKLIEFYTML